MLKTRLVHSRFQPQLGWNRKQPQSKSTLNGDQIIRCLMAHRPIDQNMSWNTSAPGQPNGGKGAQARVIDDLDRVARALFDQFDDQPSRFAQTQALTLSERWTRRLLSPESL